jgi:hypothetical protein
VIVKAAFGDRWPSGHPGLVRVAWGARGASALSPLVAAGSYGLLWDVRRCGQSFGGVLQPLAGLPAGVVPAQATNRGKGWCTHPPEGLR